MATRRRAPDEKQLRCSQCRAPLRARDRFCPSCGAPRTAAVAQALPSPSLQVAGHDEMSLGEQRKVVTVMFADLSGSTLLGERLDPEELRGILASFFNVLSRQIQRYEGTVDKYIGDAIMAVFGAPVSHEDDAERAISAAMAMQGSIAKLNDDLETRHGVRLGLRIGINTGEVVAGMLAGEVQAAYTVVGDTVNTAQRFEANAPLGQILVSAMTRQLAIHSFEFETLTPIVMKNKANPVPAYRVVRRRYEEIEPEATPFVGRVAQLEPLRGATIAAILGRGSVYHLTGEAGVGKSRIVGELRAGLVAGVERLTVRCASFERHSPYAVVADLIRGAFQIGSAEDPGSARAAVVAGLATLGGTVEEVHIGLLLDVLGYSEQSGFDPEKKRSILLHLLRQLLRAQTDRALVMTAEDLHWADDASLALIGDLVGDVPGLPCLFVTTARPEWSPPWNAEILRVEPLDSDEARKFVDAAFGVPTDPLLVDSILARTGGNPFFIEEVVRSLKVSNLLLEVTGRVALRADSVAGVPATIQEMLEARIDRLPIGARGVIGIASVIGRTFWYRVLERLTAGRSIKEDVGTLEDERLVTVASVSPELTYAFRQALIQEVAYQTQLQSARREAHGLVAEAIESLFSSRLTEFVDVLAYHYARSAQTSKAVRWLVRAGDRARRLYANGEAVRAYSDAIALGADGNDRRAAVEGLADVDATLGHLEPARTRYAEAVDLTSDPTTRARLERKIGFTYMRAGEFRSASEWQRRALATIGSRPSAELPPIWLDIGQTAWRQGELDEAISACRRGIAAAEAAEMPGLVAEGLRQLGTALVLKGVRDEGADNYRRALALYESLNDPFGVMAVRNNFGVLYRRQDRLDEALRQQEAALETARRIGDIWSTGTILNNNGEVLRYQGRHQEALLAYEEALRLWSEVGDAAGIALQHMNIGILRAELGDADAARASLLRALDEYERVESKRFLPELFRTLARLDLPGDPTAARVWAARAHDVAREIGARDEEAIALQMLGRSDAALGKLPEAIAGLEESVRILRETRDRLELARSLLALADVSRRAGRDAEAVRDLAREAARLFEEVGASGERAEAEALSGG